MKIKILQSISSPTYSYAAGQVVKTSKERAAEFVEYGIAEPVVERATKKTATKKKGDADADDG